MRRVDAALNRGASIPSLEPDTRAWTPFMYFEYDVDYSVITHRSDPFTELIRLLESSESLASL